MTRLAPTGFAGPPPGAFVLLLGCMVMGGVALAQQPPRIEDIQTLRANPLSGLHTVTLQYQANVGVPSQGEVQSVWTLQAVWSFPLGENWSLITYPSFPVVSQPDPSSGDGHVAGLGDTVVTAVVTPTETGRFIWGVGAVLEVPTATSRELGTSRWAAGPALALFVQPNPWTAGVLVENAWSFAGGGGEAVDEFEAQYFLTWNLAHGWFLESNTTITANWEADPANRWTVPVGGGFGKVFTVGKESLSASAQAFYNAVRPGAGPNWSAGGSLQLLFP